MWVSIWAVSHFPPEAPADRWHSWTVTRLRNESVHPAAHPCSILTCKLPCYDVCVCVSVCVSVCARIHEEWSWFYFRPGTAAWRPASCDLSTPSPFLPPSPFLSAVEVRAVTLRLAGLRLGRGRAEADSLALRPWRAVQKYLPQQRGCAVPSWPFHSSLSSAPSIAPSLSPLPALRPGSLAASVQPLFILFNFFPKIQHPDDPVSGPWAELSGSERKKKQRLGAVWEVDGSDEITKQTHSHEPRWRRFKNLLFLFFFFFVALNPLFQITWREKSSVICSVIMTAWVRCPEARLASFFLPGKALKVEPVVGCALSNDKSDLSYQTNTACVWKRVCVCVCVCVCVYVCVCVCGLCISLYQLHVCNGSMHSAVCACIACSHMFSAAL